MNTLADSDMDATFSVILPRPLRALEPEHIIQIEQALAEVGPDGEVNLIIENGTLQRIEKLQREALELDSRLTRKVGA